MKAQFVKTPGNVFVKVAPPESMKQVANIRSQFEDWTKVANSVASEPTAAPVSTSELTTPIAHTINSQELLAKANGVESITDDAPKPAPAPSPLPTIEKVFDAFLPHHIESTRWGRYILPGPASRVFDGSIFIYNDPCGNFWSLYNLAKGLFSEAGIRLLKSGCVWEARIPIDVLTDKGFVDSGLASVEKTILTHTGIDPTSDDTETKPVKLTVREIELERGMKRLNESVEAEKAYWDRWDVEAKRKVALKRLAELEVKNGSL